MPIPESMEHEKSCAFTPENEWVGDCDEQQDCNSCVNARCAPDCPQCLNERWAKWVLRKFSIVAVNDIKNWKTIGVARNDVITCDELEALKKLAGE